jgi:type IV pilus assembly protein PilW
MDLDIVGASDTRVSGVGDSYGAHNTRGVNASDSLRVRFFGRSRPGGDGTEPDGAMIDCMGFAQPGPSADKPVSAGPRLELLLRRRSRGQGARALLQVPRFDGMARSRRSRWRAASRCSRSSTATTPMATAFPEQWLDAAQLEAMAASQDKVADEWRKVVGLRIGMVARSAHARGGGRGGGGALSAGHRFSELSFRPPADGRLRRVATFTVMLRNPMKGLAS